MSKYLYILDAGHGGLDHNGKYVTAGKRSPKFDDGSVLYEGVNNRDNVARILTRLKQEGLDAVDIVSDWNDVSLTTRVSRANKLAKTRRCVYISIHSDANGNGTEWNSASGISVFTSVGRTLSDAFATCIINELQDNFKDSVKWRFDSSDGDKDKEAHFYVLKKTICPAVLVEAGFHTNKAEATRMLTDEWKDKLTNSIVEACKIWEDIL